MLQFLSSNQQCSRSTEVEIKTKALRASFLISIRVQVKRALEMVRNRNVLSLKITRRKTDTGSFPADREKARVSRIIHGLRPSVSCSKSLSPGCSVRSRHILVAFSCLWNRTSWYMARNGHQSINQINQNAFI